MLDGAIKYWKGVDNVFRFVKFVFETGVKFEANLKEKFDSNGTIKTEKIQRFSPLPVFPPREDKFTNNPSGKLGRSEELVPGFFILKPKTENIKMKYNFNYRVMVFNATFNNMSVISWRSILLVEKTEVP